MHNECLRIYTFGIQIESITFEHRPNNEIIEIKLFPKLVPNNSTRTTYALSSLRTLRLSVVDECHTEIHWPTEPYSMQMRLNTFSRWDVKRTAMNAMHIGVYWLYDYIYFYWRVISRFCSFMIGKLMQRQKRKKLAKVSSSIPFIFIHVVGVRSRRILRRFPIDEVKR